MEPKQKTPGIIQLMGKENKKQTRKTHQAITAAFRKGKDGKTQDGEIKRDS